MASSGFQMGLILVLMGMLWAGVNAQSCTTALTSLSPCLNYITGNSSTPSSSCCSQLKTVVQSSPQCLCTLLNGGASLGITINQTLALQLPGTCQVQTPSISQCNNGGTSATPPAASPTGSPSDSSDETPDSGAITPSASDIPTVTGSKSVPSINGGSSDASAAKAFLHSVISLLFIATVARF
ncbi:glycosylphosphatidylinositol-anchored lipid protein transfer 15 [Hibiscus trionum]|uniref:Glycosylphosphatidylinositol-anchored lipid protein transfer 15 n=1 Tax=Hibiscus trionum TaxID=183268 RepID=A0A9W7ILF5_HIBTR|nr:glycosylphosphatidylinositol-anchored lipid protein transfer 15 [Hibiscus trionum]